MSEFNKYSTDGGATFIDVEDSNAVHWGDQSKGYVGKNLLKNNASTITISGVSFTVNSDGSVTLNGTATANITSFFINSNLALKAGSYWLTGNPSGITGTSYGLRIANTSYSVNTFFEQGKILTLNQDYSDLRIDIRIPSGQVIDNLTFYPMIRLASIPDSTYEPYLTPNTEIDNMYPNEANNILGAKNLFKIVNKPNSIAGITPQYNDDGSVFIAGGQTSTGEGGIQLINRANSYPLPVGDYILSGTPKGFSWSSMCLYYDRRNNDDTGWDGYQKKDEGNGIVISVTEEKKNNKYIISIRIANGYTVPSDGILFKPMLRPLSVRDDTYASYAMTNKELTTKVQGIIDAATNAGDFAAFKTAIGNL